MDACSDLAELVRHCEKQAAVIVEELGDAYGPRLWLGFGRKKRALAAARAIEAEASLMRRTSTEVV